MKMSAIMVTVALAFVVQVFAVAPAAADEAEVLHASQLSLPGQVDYDVLVDEYSTVSSSSKLLHSSQLSLQGEVQEFVLAPHKQYQASLTTLACNPDLRCPSAS